MTVSEPVVVAGPVPGDRRAPVPVVPPALVRPAAVLVAVCVLAVAAWGFVVHGASEPGHLDQVLAVAVRQHLAAPGLIAYGLDGLVTPVPVLVVIGLLAVVALALRRPRFAVVAVVGPLGSYVLTSAVKEVVGRTIHGAHLSYPSGHSAFATAAGLVVGLLAVSVARLHRTAAAVLALLVALLCGVVMAVDQVLLDAHYPTDTIGGILTGLALVLTLGLVLDAVVGRFRRPI